jgi:hypothetical protein
MKKILFILSLSATVSMVQAQSGKPLGVDAQRNLDVLGSQNLSTYVNTFDERYKGVKGTPFFLAQWGKADLLVQDKYIYEQVDLKYNVYENHLLYRKPTGDLIILEPKQISSFTLTDSLGLHTYSFKRLQDVTGHDAITVGRFFLMLHEGEKAMLAMLPIKDMVKADYKGSYSANRDYDELVEEHIYFFVDATKRMQRVKLNKKSLQKLVADKQDQVNAYLAKERIDASTEEGWIKTLAYYETL